MKKYFSKNEKAFTLIELLIVCTIIAVLAVVAVVSYNSARTKSRDSKRITDSQTIGAALEQYYEVVGNYPKSDGCSASSLPSVDWCNSAQTAITGSGQWINDNSASDSSTKTLVNYLPAVPVDPLNATPTQTDSMDPNVYYYATSSATSGSGQTYYLVMTLEDKNNSFVTQNQGIAGNAGPKSGTGSMTTTCYNEAEYYKFSPTTAGDGVVTLGRNRSDTRNVAACE